MADSASYVGSTPVNNPLLSAAGNSFPYENFTSTAQLVPISQRVSSISLSEDVGEADSFLGQDALPSLPLPGVLPSALKTPSPEQLQPITFFNSLGQPTGGGGLDFLAPAGVNSKSIESSNQPRYKHLVNKRRPFSATLGLSPSKSLSVPPASCSSDLLHPVSVASTSTIKSPLLQEPSITPQLSLIQSKSSSTPTSPKTEVLNSSTSSEIHISKSQPSTVKPSPVHVQSTLHVNQVTSKPENSSSQPDAGTAAPEGNAVGQSLVQKLLNLASETLSPSPREQVFSSEPEVYEAKLAAELANKDTSSLPPSIEFSDSAETKSELEVVDFGNKLETNGTGSVTPSATTPIPSDVTDSVSNAAIHSSLEVTDYQIFSQQSSDIPVESITSSVKQTTSLTSSNQPHTSYGVDLISLSNEPLPLSIPDESFLQPETEILTPKDHTSPTTDQSQVSHLTETEFPAASDKVGDLVLISETESEVSAKQAPLTSQPDTDPDQCSAKSVSPVSQAPSLEGPPSQPYTTPNLIHSTNFAVAPQHTDHIVRSSEYTPHTNYPSTEIPHINQNQFLPPLSTAHAPTHHQPNFFISQANYTSETQSGTVLSNAQPPSNQYLPFGTQQNQTHISHPPRQSGTTRPQSSPNPYRVTANIPSVAPPHQFSNSPTFNPQQFLIPSAQKTTENTYSQPPLVNSPQFPVNKTHPPPFFSPISQQPSLTAPPPSTPPLIPLHTPPPVAQQIGNSHSSSNRYSIHARPAHLRNPYKVYAPNSQSSPLVSHPEPPQSNNYLIPSESSSESLSSVPLTSETNFGISSNPSIGQATSPVPPLPSSSPSAPPSATQFIAENNLNPFSAQTAVSPQSNYIQKFENSSAQHTPINTFASYTKQTGLENRNIPDQISFVNTSTSYTTQIGIENHNLPDQIPSFVDVPSANTSPAAGTLIQPQPSQGYSSDSLNAATPPNTVPPISSSLHPPSGIPLGSAKGYRLGKQRPKYAQVPDLVVSPSSPLFSPLALSSDLPSASPPVYSPYQPQECFVPSENYISPNSEFSSLEFSNLATHQGINVASAVTGYQPVYCHWFFKKEVETKVIWKPFSVIDSVALENAFNSSETTAETVVPTDGGRYDVRILERKREALYWEEKKPTEVRRCSWFYKGPLDSRYTPYEEVFAAQLEEEYKIAVQSNKWNRKVEHNGETVVMHGPVVMVHYSPAASTDQIGVPTDTSPVKPRVVKRGVDEFEFEEGETSKVDHLLFLVHGIGSVCDLKFRDVVETVDDFRSLALQLTRSHFSSCVDSGQANRVEVLPVSWHGKLHGEDTGIDKKLQSITLKSIPRLRHFTNDTLLDILFYTSPVYCQTIMDTVGNEMNRMYDLFLKRNPDFSGTVCLGGHSLGSLILFDLLYHQKIPRNLPSSPAIVMTVPGSQPPRTESKPKKEEEGSEEEDDIVDDSAMAMNFSRSSGYNRRASRVNYMMGPAGTGQPYISYPQLKFKPESFFALGSPIGMFVTVRGIETLGSNFRLPTCPGFFNIFHPFDPVAYRIESLIDPELAPTLRPVLIPHHKGRKRMHLELKETMQRVGSDLKNKLVDSVKNTWNTMTQYTMFSRPEPPPQQTLEQEVTKAIEAHLGPSQVDVSAGETESESGDQPTDVTLGCLNGGRRVDYVLQEAPLESFNEYLFALQSHVCYWESEDTMLMILTEVYRSSGVSPDSAILGSDLSRERSPIRLLSDQLLPSTSPPKPQLFSSLRFPSSASISSDGSGESMSRSQSVPKLSREPNPALLSTSSPPGLPGTLPQMGMDPTAPIADARNLAPPPTVGFVKQALQRK